jgi:hypothetical protein
VPLVGAVYGFLAVACLGALLTLPASPGLGAALLGTLGAVLVTAFGAAPAHGRLADGPTPELVGRLLLLDRWRLAGALVALAGALAQALA